MIDNEEQRQGGPDEVPTDEQLDVEGPNESTQPSGGDTPLGEGAPEESEDQA
jgi:hypothetical protein